MSSKNDLTIIHCFVVRIVIIILRFINSNKLFSFFRALYVAYFGVCFIMVCLIVLSMVIFTQYAECDLLRSKRLGSADQVSFF